MYSRRHSYRFAQRAGFTLIELMVVIAIIGLLSSITFIELLVVIAIIGLLSSITFAALRVAEGKSWTARSAHDLRTVELALDLYYQDYGTWPTPSATTLPTGGWITVLGVALQPYLKTMPLPKFTTCCAGGYFTQGYIYYRATTGSPQHIPMWNGNTNTFAGCLLLEDGYWLDFLLPEQSSLTLNDGGVDPDAIETGRGEYSFSSNPADCP